MSQKIFIPNINSLLILTEPWAFKLYFDYSNRYMLEVFGVKKNSDYIWVYNQKLNDFFEDGKIPDCVKYESPLLEHEFKNAYKSYQLQRPRAFVMVTLPSGSHLTITNISVKRGQEANSYISLRVLKNCPDDRFKSKRFWVSTNDANNIVANVF